MQLIRGRNVNEAYNEALWSLKVRQIAPEDSRNGLVKRYPGPVLTCYEYPCERVLFDVDRDANPFFHLFESLWMLQGRDDVEFPAKFAKQIREYSDDGETLNGAYGKRWRTYFNIDQIDWVIHHLKMNPNSRRAVLAMWDAETDTWSVDKKSKDVPCNTHIYFSVRGAFLDMTVSCRSNDVIWGCYGANAVHFSVLQEYIAGAIGINVGSMYQFSNDWHIYERHWPLIENVAVSSLDGYPDKVRLLEGINYHSFMRALGDWFCGINKTGSFFLDRVATPMFQAHDLWRNGDLYAALDICETIAAEDWRIASSKWLDRRKKDA